MRSHLFCGQKIKTKKKNPKRTKRLLWVSRHIFPSIFSWPNSLFLNCVWLFWVSVAVCGLSPVVASRGSSPVAVHGFSLWWLLLLRSTVSRHMGLVALWHVGTSQTRDRTSVPCTARQILNCWTTRETLLTYFLSLTGGPYQRVTALNLGNLPHGIKQWSCHWMWSLSNTDHWEACRGCVRGQGMGRWGWRGMLKSGHPGQVRAAWAH